MAMSDKIKVFKSPNGNVSVAVFNLNAMRPGETEEEFIERECRDKIRPTHKPDVLEFNSTRQEIDTVIKTSPKGHFERLKVSNSGKLEIDENKKTKKEISDEKKNSVSTKLKTLGLTQDEVDIIFRKNPSD